MNKLANLLRLTFSFKGAINRSEYLYGFIVSIILFLIFVYMPFLTGFNDLYQSNYEKLEKLFSASMYLFSVVLFLIINAAISTKRLRDLQWPLSILPFFIAPLGVFQIIGMSLQGKIVPSVEKTVNSLKGLRGWLLLVGLGLIIRLIQDIIDITQEYYFMFIHGQFIEIMVGLVLVIPAMILEVYIFFLFFKERKRFPIWNICFLIISLIFSVILLLSDNNYAQNYEANIKYFFRSLLICIIWIPYFLVSKRVKATFVN